MSRKLLFSSLIVLIACSFNGQEIIQSEKLNFRLHVIETGLSIPWGMEFMPNGDILISEKSGTIHVLRNEKLLDQQIKGVPKVYNRGQGGLFDIELHPDYKNNGWIYISYAAPDPGGNGGITYVMRARLKDFELVDQEIIFKGAPFTRAGVHFGGRLEFGPEGYLYFSIGERGEKEKAQDIGTVNGKIYRIKDDGSIPEDNPFVNIPNANKAAFCYGNRNPQGLAKHPETGEIWETEHGPMGGDELNIIRSGKNYGWPKITYGIDYNGAIISKDTALPGMEQPVIYWKPSIATSSMTFVKGDKYPGWKGNLLIAGLTAPFFLERLELEGDKVVHQERLYKRVGRVRNVEQSPDGYIYVAVEGGQIMKIIPQ
ncbi:MAG TPA: PQQ-dependent sugar dehydrogenase [Parasegetibacter sp.]